MKNFGHSGCRRAGVISMALLTVFLFSGATAPQQCQQQSIGPSTGTVVAGGVAIVAGVAIGTVVLVEVHKNHHQVKGCVSQGASGLEARTDEGKLWALSGDVASVKPGDVVKVHGNRVSRAKTGAPGSGEQMFFVESLKKDYGACKLMAVSPKPVAGTPDVF